MASAPDSPAVEAAPAGADAAAACDGTAAKPAAGPQCCPQFHDAIELVGKRWSGAILFVLLQHGEPMRFRQIARAVPELSDRLLSERMKELEQRGLVERRVQPCADVKVAYALTDAGRALEPALQALRTWACGWL